MVGEVTGVSQVISSTPQTSGLGVKYLRAVFKIHGEQTYRGERTRNMISV